MIQNRLAAMTLASALTILSACDRQPTDSTGPVAGPLLARSLSDTIPCPTNPWGYTTCTSIPADTLDILRAQGQRILDGAAGQCLEAGHAIMGALSGPVVAHHNSSPSAGITFDASQGPPYQPVTLFVGHFLLWSEHVEAGNTLDMLYHEGSHLLGLLDPAAASFAQACVDQHIEEDDFHEPASGTGGGDPEGDECTESNPCDTAPTTCVVRYWYWKDTLEVISYTVLYCY